MVAYKDPLFKDEELDARFMACLGSMHVKQATTCIFFYFLVGTFLSITVAFTIGSGTNKEALEFILIPLHLVSSISLIYALKLESSNLLIPSMITLLLNGLLDMIFVITAFVTILGKGTFISDWIRATTYQFMQDDVVRWMCFSLSIVTVGLAALNYYLAYILYRCHNYFKEAKSKRSAPPLSVVYHA